MKKIILGLLLLLLISSKVYSAILPLGTTTGTRVFGTANLPFIPPFIVDIEIIPPKAVLMAGETLKFQSYLVWSTGLREARQVSFWGNNVTVNGMFRATKTGYHRIIASHGNIEKVIFIEVLPTSLLRIEPIIKKKIIYNERINFDTTFAAKGYDKYDNEIKIEGASYTFIRNEVGSITQWMRAIGLININPLLATGFVRDGNNILFFESGTFTMTVSKNHIVGTKSFNVVFEKEFQDITSTDYHLIDFDEKSVTIGYKFPGYQEKIINIPINERWIDYFYKGGYLEKLQVVGWIHYQTVQKRKELLQEIKNKEFRDQIFIPLSLKLVTPEYYGTVTKSEISCSNINGQQIFLADLELYVNKTGYFISKDKNMKEYIKIDKIKKINFHRDRNSKFKDRKVEFSGEGKLYNSPKKFDVMITQPQGRQGIYTIIIYNLEGEEESKLQGVWLGDLKMNIGGEEYTNIVNFPVRPIIPILIR